MKCRELRIGISEGAPVLDGHLIHMKECRECREFVEARDRFCAYAAASRDAAPEGLGLEDRLLVRLRPSRGSGMLRGLLAARLPVPVPACLAALLLLAGLLHAGIVQVRLPEREDAHITITATDANTVSVSRVKLPQDEEYVLIREPEIIIIYRPERRNE